MTLASLSLLACQLISLDRKCCGHSRWPHGQAKPSPSMHAFPASSARKAQSYPLTCRVHPIQHVRTGECWIPPTLYARRFSLQTNQAASFAVRPSKLYERMFTCLGPASSYSGTAPDNDLIDGLQHKESLSLSHAAVLPASLKQRPHASKVTLQLIRGREI